MKTLLVTVAFAIAVGACSSDSSNALVTGSTGTVPQGGLCTLSTDCEPMQGLTCAFPIVNDEIYQLRRVQSPCLPRHKLVPHAGVA